MIMMTRYLNDNDNVYCHVTLILCGGGVNGVVGGKVIETYSVVN